MPKISVIVPVYNTGKYLKKCLNSIINQKMNDFELIIVNDGSTDNSEEIIKKYEDKYPQLIKYYYKQNGGLSDARNFGVEKAVGSYLCFIDSDDYISVDLFEKINGYTENNIDLIKYKCRFVENDGKEIRKIDGPVFNEKDGQEAFNELYSKDILIEPAWLYLYRREFFSQNKFKFPKDKYHEDWAIVPYIIINAKSVVSTEIYGYYYVQSSNSITRNNKPEKIFKRALDMLEHYDNLLKNISDKEFDKITSDNLKIFMTNCLILKLEELPKQYHKQYIKELKKRKIVKNIKIKNIKQLIKKIILMINVKLYLKIR